MSATTMKALTLSSFSSPPEITTKPIPTPTPGSIIVKPLTVSTLSYANEVYITRKRAYPMQLPLTIGSSAVARVHAVGTDATLFKEGDLVLVDIFIRGRDDPGVNFLFGLIEGHSAGGRRLMGGEWRDATYVFLFSSFIVGF
jgi:NADPH:quinone reductase-like Zn-dependent oxidoreductase